MCETPASILEAILISQENDAPLIEDISSGYSCVNLRDITCNGYQVRFLDIIEGGNIVEIWSDIGIKEVIYVPDKTDWIPFITAYLNPLVATVSQIGICEKLEVLTNGLISWARHGEGKHIDTNSGISRIDEIAAEQYRERLRQQRLERIREEEKAQSA